MLDSEAVLNIFKKILRPKNYAGSNYGRLETSSQLSFWDYMFYS